MKLKALLSLFLVFSLPALGAEPCQQWKELLKKNSNHPKLSVQELPAHTPKGTRLILLSGLNFEHLPDVLAPLLKSATPPNCLFLENSGEFSRAYWHDAVDFAKKNKMHVIYLNRPQKKKFTQEDWDEAMSDDIDDPYEEGLCHRGVGAVGWQHLTKRPSADASLPDLMKEAQVKTFSAYLLDGTPTPSASPGANVPPRCDVSDLLGGAQSENLWLAIP